MYTILITKINHHYASTICLTITQRLHELNTANDTYG